MHPTADRTRAVQESRIILRRIFIYVFGGLAALVITAIIAFYVRHAYIRKYVRIEHSTYIYCIDSSTGKPVRISFKWLKDGSRDDDPDSIDSIAVYPDGRLWVDYNVWVLFKITAPGYHDLQLRLDDRSPVAMTVKLARNTSSTAPNAELIK